jgi:hypothetical protein
MAYDGNWLHTLASEVRKVLCRNSSVHGMAQEEGTGAFGNNTA